MKVFHPNVHLILPLIFITVFTSISLAQNDNPSTVPYRSVTPQVESTIEKTVIVALRRISQARSDIHRKALANARYELTEAARLIEGIKDNLSTSNAKNLVKVARNHLSYEQPQQVLRDFPPIYASLEMASIYLPIDKAKRHLDRAKDYLNKNDKRKADRELALTDRSLIIIEVEQPLLRSQRYVTKALGYLSAKNPKKTDEALQLAEQHAMELFSPLYLANQNLWLAFSNYSTARNTETRKHLEQARNNLNKVAADRGLTMRKETDKLLMEVSELEKKLAVEEKDAESGFKATWEMSKALVERSVAYLSAGLSEAETTLGGERSLIEAKLHVAYAETYQLTMTEQDKAITELDTAYSYLQKAAASPQAGQADRKIINRVGKALMELKNNNGKSDVIQERYDAVKDELNSLIQKM